jgi:small nuclear ribonucleoprotein (snRNP)-like protein
MEAPVVSSSSQPPNTAGLASSLLGNKVRIVSNGGSAVYTGVLSGLDSMWNVTLKPGRMLQSTSGSSHPFTAANAGKDFPTFFVRGEQIMFMEILDS